ncbi:hypothetical protein C4D60_Mb01t17730 [Musa balbisiana]|uniref:Uncharacterized protein n=1 Tax=Musa balbisiana TaxID=52838 RepID=A0A4S8JPB1_MUSBA|nr:hypothetical protein C4D60_Mb01t17730 [Musa balbisiana]
MSNVIRGATLLLASRGKRQAQHARRYLFLQNPLHIANLIVGGVGPSFRPDLCAGTRTRRVAGLTGVEPFPGGNDVPFPRPNPPAGRRPLLPRGTTREIPSIRTQDKLRRPRGHGIKLFTPTAPSERCMCFRMSVIRDMWYGVIGCCPELPEAILVVAGPIYAARDDVGRGQLLSQIYSGASDVAPYLPSEVVHSG